MTELYDTYKHLAGKRVTVHKKDGTLIIGTFPKMAKEDESFLIDAGSRNAKLIKNEDVLYISAI